MGTVQHSQPNRSSRRVRRLLAAIAGITLFGRLAEGNTLTWDASGTSAFAPEDGSGTWDSATPLWSDGTNDNIWQNGNSATAVFGSGGTPGTVTLGTSITAGGITFNSSYTINAGSGELDLNGGNITLNNNANASVNNFLGGTASIIGNGTLTLTGNADNNGLGMTVGTGATLILAKDSSTGVHAVGGGGLTIDSGGTVQLAGTGADQIYDYADIRTDTGGLFDLNGTSETIHSLYGIGGTVLNSAPGTTSTFTFIGSEGDYFGVIEDNAGTGGIVALAVTNNGTQKLESANSYSGGTTINSGTLILNVYDSLGTGPVTLGSASGDATLIGDGTNAFTNSVPNAINVNGGGNNTISANGWNPTFAGAITLNNANVTLQSNNPYISSLNITGGITGNGNVSIAVLANGASQVNISGAPLNNSGTITDNSTTGTANIGAVIGNNVTGLIENSSGSNLVLSAANTYSGPTMLSAGTLQLSNSNALQNSTLTMAGGSLVFDGAVSQNAFTFGGLAASSSGAGYDIALANSAGAAVTLTVGSNDASTAYAGVLSGAGSIVKTGNGVLILKGSSTYTGSTAVSGGTISIQNATSLFNATQGNNAAQAISIARGATLELDETNPSGEWTLGTASAVTITGNGTLQLNQTGSGTFAGLIALGDQGPGHFVKLSMCGGTIDLEGGTLRNGGWSGGVWSGNDASLNVAGGATLDLWDGNPVMVDGLTGNGTITHTSYGGAGSNLTVGVNNDANGPATFAGTITEASGFPTSLTKVGTGAQVLAGANSYSGGTVISGGTLSVNNAVGIGTGSGTVIVANGGTLRGSGTIGNTNGSLTINSGGTIAAGADAVTNGALATESQIWNGGGNYTWKITNLGDPGAGPGSGASGSLGGGGGHEGTDWDLLNITAGGLDLVSLNSGEPFTVTPLGTITSGNQQYSWVIVQSAGQNSINGVPIGTNLAAGNGGSGLFVLNTSGFTDTSNTAAPSSFTLEAVNFGSTEDLVLDYDGAPEPGTAALLLAGAGPMLMARRRKVRGIIPHIPNDEQADDESES